MNKTIKIREIFRTAGAALAVSMCPCIIAFGLGMSQTGLAADQSVEVITGTVEQGSIGAEAALGTGSEAADERDMAASGKDTSARTEIEKTAEGTETEPETASSRERVELMARIKHLSDYGKNDGVNPDYRQKGYVYTEEMYYKLTGATELPDDWIGQMGPLMRGIIKEEASFEETEQTDDGALQKQWQPENLIDASLYLTAPSISISVPGALGAVQAAQQRLGYPYSQARRDSGIAYDCSSLVYWAYLDAGINIDPENCHTAASIACYLEGTGRGVSGGELLPGDLIFYSYKQNGRYKDISHVAMVAGDGMMVHASSSRKMVVVTPLNLDKAVAVARPVMDAGEENPIILTDLEGPANPEETTELATPAEAEMPEQEIYQGSPVIECGPGMAKIQDVQGGEECQETQGEQAPQEIQDAGNIQANPL